MARIYPLFSSSKGNATFIGSGSEGILIDAGASYSRLCAAMTSCGLDISAVKAVFITHDHSDHIKGLPVLTKKTGIPVFAQERTFASLVEKSCINSSGIIIDGTVEIGTMSITPFSTPHDTEQSCGYRIETDDGKVCAVCTDLGCITQEVDRNLTGCDLVLLEANYDKNMLRTGRYPDYLKARIGSNHGHLSNDDCAEYIKKLVENGTKRLILGHLSEENNRPVIAENTVTTRLSQFRRNVDYMLEIAPVQTDGQLCMTF